MADAGLEGVSILGSNARALSQVKPGKRRSVDKCGQAPSSRMPMGALPARCSRLAVPSENDVLGYDSFKLLGQGQALPPAM